VVPYWDMRDGRRERWWLHRPDILAASAVALPMVNGHIRSLCGCIELLEDGRVELAENVGRIGGPNPGAVLEDVDGGNQELV
jgi:hypothetical protein